MKFIIETELITLNDYIDAERSHKYKAAKVKKFYTMICKNYAKKIKNRNLDSLFDLIITWNVTSNKRDPDNIYFGVKFILDGLVAAKVIKNDGRKNIRNIHHYIKTTKKYSIEVELVEVK